MHIFPRFLLVAGLVLSLGTAPVHAEPKQKTGCLRFSLRMMLTLTAIAGAGAAGYHYYLEHQRHLARLKYGQSLMTGDYDQLVHLSNFKTWAQMGSPQEVHDAIRSVAAHTANIKHEHQPTPRYFFRALENLAVQDPTLAVRFQRRGINVALRGMEANPSREELEKALVEFGLHEYEAVKAGNRRKDYSFKDFDFLLYNHAKRFQEWGISEEQKAKVLNAAETVGYGSGNEIGAYVAKRLFESGREPLTALKEMHMKVDEGERQKNPQAKWESWTERDQRDADIVRRNLGNPTWDLDTPWQDTATFGDISLNGGFKSWVKLQADKGVKFRNLDEAIDVFIGK